MRGSRSEDWAAALALYGFAPLRNTGTTMARGFEVDVDTSLSTPIPLIDIEGQGPLELRLRKEGNWPRTWTQPLLDIQASLFLTPGPRAFARADIGGPGLAGEDDLSGNAQAGLGLALGASTQLDLS